jgi:salicylate hydroxylase
LSTRTTEDGVTAEFAGGHTATADLLVGADGIWSTTRRIIDPGAPEPTYAGIYSVSGISPASAAGLPAVEPGAFNMVFARNGAFIYLAVGDGTVWWSAQVASPTPPDMTANVDVDQLAGLYRHEERPLAILRAATTVRRPTLEHVLAEVPAWHGDRTVLLGDACHPVGAGQGASMAIEDAVVLARSLGLAPSIPDALTRYDKARRARVGKMTKAASVNRDAKTKGPIGRRLSDLMMPIVFRHFYQKATGWLYAHELGALPTAEGVPR